jgi:hypothetical protein
MDDGMAVVARLRRDYVEEYIDRLLWIGVDRRGRLAPNYQKVLET